MPEEEPYVNKMDAKDLDDWMDGMGLPQSVLERKVNLGEVVVKFGDDKKTMLEWAKHYGEKTPPYSFIEEAAKARAKDHSEPDWKQGIFFVKDYMDTFGK